MATQPQDDASSERAIARAETSTLKAIGSTQLDGAAPRAMFQPSNMGEAMELGRLMAHSNFVPPHLRGKPGDCLAVIMQASRWGMDPFAVASKSYFVNDRIAYEAQMVNAVINSSGVLDGRLKIEWEGDGDKLVCFVTGKIKGDPEPKSRRVAIRNITTRNSPLWKQDPEQQLAYYSSRAWTRLHAPEVLMGVYTPDELDAAIPMGGAAGFAASAKPLTVEAIEHQAAGAPNDTSEPPIKDAEIEPVEDSLRNVVALESAKAEIDGCELVHDVNARVAELLPLFGEEDADALRGHAMDRIAALNGS